MEEYIVVLCTVPDENTASEMAEKLVAEKLAACVNHIKGLISIYRWQDKIEKDAESLLIVKTRQDLFSALKAKIVSLHPYQVPEIIALPIIKGHPPYLDWVRKETSQ